MKSFPFILIVLAALVSCGHNRMKINQKALTKQILTEEEQLAKEEAIRVEKEKQLADSLAKLPKGFRFKEDRKVDPNNPPVIIDFTSESPSREVKLSEIGQKITYVRLSVPNDSLYFSPGMGGDVSFTRDNIILNNNFGVHRFSRDGKYIEAIANSNIETRQNNKQAAFGYFEKENYRGVWVNHVSVAGNRIFYKFSDYPNGKVSLLGYELKSDNGTVNFKEGQENKGDKSFTKGAIITSGKEAILSGTPGLSSTYIYGLSSDFYAGVNSHLDANRTGFMLATFNLKGDTLCKFTQFDKLETPITSNLIRSVNSIINWEYKGVFSFIKSFNDTIFRLVPPNRLIPVYVFKFGPHKITDEEWYQTNKELKNKFLITSVLENDKYLFVEFDYYDANGESESHNAIYTKATHSLTQLPLEEKATTPNNSSPGFGPASHTFKPTINFLNDIDNGLPFWPHFVTPRGELGMLVLPERLKTYLQKGRYKLETEKAKELERLAITLKLDINERIIMLVK